MPAHGPRGRAARVRGGVTPIDTQNNFVRGRRGLHEVSDGLRWDTRYSGDAKCRTAPDEAVDGAAGTRYRGRRPASGSSAPLRRNTAASGGSVSVRDCGRPCIASGSASTPPMLPCPLPP